MSSTSGGGWGCSGIAAPVAASGVLGGNAHCQLLPSRCWSQPWKIVRSLEKPDKHTPHIHHVRQCYRRHLSAVSIVPGLVTGHTLVSQAIWFSPPSWGQDGAAILNTVLTDEKTKVQGGT